jgi:hypothetical protein
MDNGGFTDYRVSTWLSELDEVWLGLHYADPNISGAYASEVFGGSYARLKTPFTDVDNRVMFNSSTVTFRGLPNVKISHIGGWDSQYNGNLEFYIPLGNPVTILAGKSYTIEANMLAISLP